MFRWNSGLRRWNRGDYRAKYEYKGRCVHKRVKYGSGLQDLGGLFDRSGLGLGFPCSVLIVWEISGGIYVRSSDGDLLEDKRSQIHRFSPPISSWTRELSSKRVHSIDS